MRCRWAGGVVGLLVWVGSAAAAEPQGKLVHETWDAAYLEGGKAGFVHTTVHEMDRAGAKVLRTTTELQLTVQRFKDRIQMRMITGNEETPAGKVTGVFMTQFLGKNQQLVLNGAVAADGDQLLVKVDNGRLERKVRWNDQVVGMYRQERLYKERKVKPGDKFDYLSYEPTVNTVINVRVVVKDEEEVEVLGLKKVGAKTDYVTREKKRLLRVETKPDKIEVPGASVQLPTMISWLDKDYLPVRGEVQIDGVGRVVFQRTTEAVAKGQDGGIARITDIGIGQLIRLNRVIPRPHDSKSVVYRVTLNGDDDPGTAFAQDDRQQIKNLKGNTFEIHVKALRSPPAQETADKPKDEFLKSCYFINSDDAKVREFARQAVRTETDPWKKAQRIEKWVHDHIENKNFTEAFATSDQVAKTLEGDCTEHAVLAAAMCRAVGVPSRAAVGLVYVNTRGGPVMGFHMWTEVWVRGQWVAIDATLGEGSIGAAHIKVADHSWHDVQSLVPLLPVMRVVGKVSIEVVSVNEAD